MRGSSSPWRSAPWLSRGRAGGEGAGVRAALSPLPSPTPPPGAWRSLRAAGPSAAPRGRPQLLPVPTAAVAMAPLLGRKPFPLVKPLPGEEPLFTIPHTQEAFRTREYPFPAARAGPGRGRAWDSRERASRASPARGSCQRAPAARGPGRRVSACACRSFPGIRRGARTGPGRGRAPFGRPRGPALCPGASPARSASSHPHYRPRVGFRP